MIHNDDWYYYFLYLNYSNAAFDVKSDQTQQLAKPIKVEKQRLLTVKKSIKKAEETLHDKLNEVQDQKEAKYKYFNYILDKCCHSRRHTKMVFLRRFYLYVLLLIGKKFSPEKIRLIWTFFLFFMQSASEASENFLGFFA